MPGVFIARDREQLYAPIVRNLAVRFDGDYHGSSGSYIELGDLPSGFFVGGTSGAVDFNGIVCPAAALTHLSQTLPSCLVFGARDFAQSLGEFACAVRHGALQQLAGPGIPSTRTCSSRSSQSSWTEARGFSS